LLLLCAENSSEVPNGLDKRSQHIQQTTEIAEVHAPPAFSNGPVDTAANSIMPDNEDTNDAVTHSSQGLSNGDVTGKNTPDPPELERDYDDDSGFPSPPVFAVNGSAAVTDGPLSDNAADSDAIQAVIDSDVVPAETAASPVTVLAASEVLDVATLVPPTSSSVSSSLAAPPPPPAPPLPSFFNTSVLPTPKPAASSQPQRSATKLAGPPSASVPPQVQADLLAAVARRRTLVDSTDAEQLAKNIESRVQRNSKLQTVYRSGSRSSELHASPVSPTTGLLAPAGEDDRPKVAAENGKCLLILDNYDAVLWEM